MGDYLIKKFLNVKTLSILGGFAALLTIIIKYHFIPLNECRTELKTCTQKIIIINNDLSTTRNKLKQCKSDLEIQQFNLEVCNMQNNFEALEHNTTQEIKDTTNEGYLIF